MLYVVLRKSTGMVPSRVSSNCVRPSLKVKTSVLGESDETAIRVRSTSANTRSRSVYGPSTLRSQFCTTA